MTATARFAPVRIQDVLLPRNEGLVRSGLAGAPIIQSWAHSPFAERVVMDHYAADDTGFFQRQWDALKGRDKRYRDVVKRVQKEGFYGGLNGWRLHTKFVALDGITRTAASHACGLTEVPVRAEQELDPISKPGLDLSRLHTLLDGIQKMKPRPLYAYNYVPGRKSVRQSEDRLKIIFEAIIDTKGRRLLDLGCADGYFGTAMTWREFDVTFVEHVPSYVRVTEERMRLAGRNATIIEGDAGKFIGRCEPFAVILCTDMFDQVVMNRSLRYSCRFLRGLIGKAKERLIFTVGKWSRVMKRGFTQRTFYDILKASGRRMRYLGRDGDTPSLYGREMYLIY